MNAEPVAIERISNADIQSGREVIGIAAQSSSEDVQRGTPWLPSVAAHQTSALSFPLHVICWWLGNSVAVARKDYLQVTDEHFEKAVQNPMHTLLVSGDWRESSGSGKRKNP